MNCATPLTTDGIKLGAIRSESAVSRSSETAYDMLEKQANRLNIQRCPSARPDAGTAAANTPRNSGSFLRNFTSGHPNVTLKALEPVVEKSAKGQSLVPSFEALRRRRCSAPEIAGKSVELPPLSARPGSVAMTVRPRARKSAIAKKSSRDENALPVQKQKKRSPTLRPVQSISSLSTHSAPDTDFHVGRAERPTPRPRSESPFRTVDKNQNVFERLSSPVKRTSNSSGSELSTTLPRRASTPARLYSYGPAARRKSVPHETLKLAIANSTGTTTPTKRSPIPDSYTSNEIENERNSISEASSPKSAEQGRYGQDGTTNEEENNATGKTNFEQTQGSADIDEETNTRIIQWLLGVEHGSKIIPENVIEDDETAETAIRIIYPGD